MNGIALAVLVSQTPKLFGVKVEKAGPLRGIWSIAVEIAGGRMNWTEFALGAATLAVIFSIKTFKGLPGILLAVAGATAIVQVFDLEKRANASVLGPPSSRTACVFHTVGRRPGLGDGSSRRPRGGARIVRRV